MNTIVSAAAVASATPVVDDGEKKRVAVTSPVETRGRDEEVARASAQMIAADQAGDALVNSPEHKEIDCEKGNHSA